LGCHLLSYLALRVRAGIEMISYSDARIATLARKDGRMRIVSATLRPRVTIRGGVVEHQAKAQALHEQAHHVCFIANSVNFPITCEATLSTGWRFSRFYCRCKAVTRSP
jgi:organic hydroperoxide reductase OsmC/OhrA